MKRHCSPIATFAAFLTICVGGMAITVAAAAAADKVVNVEFTPTPAPVSEADLVSVYTRSSAIVTYASGVRKVFPLSHHVLFRSGDRIGKGEAGLIVDKDGQPILSSAPVGAEHTGLQVVPNLNGHTYIMRNLQHPAAANDLKQYPDAIKVELRQKVDQRGAVGYLGGLPMLPR